MMQSKNGSNDTQEGVAPQNESLLQSPVLGQGTPPSDRNGSHDKKALQIESLLMALPPEMRNRIYRACLVEGNIIIHPSRTSSNLPTEPSLLRTCRQIRKEATSIYYKENDFVFHISAYDAGKYIRWCKSARRRMRCNMSFVFIDYNKNWDNLMSWLEAHWRGECYVPRNEMGAADALDTMIHMKNIMKKMAIAGLQWEIMKPMLEDVRELLGQTNVRWLA